MIIDTHMHIGTMLNFHMPEEYVMESMNKYHVDYSLISNIEAAEFDHQLRPVPLKDQRSQLETLKSTIKFARKYPNKIGVAAWIKPNTEGVTGEFISLLEKNLDIVFAIKVHPYHSNTPFDSLKLDPYIEIAAKYNLPIVTHTGCSDVDAPFRVYNMALKYPNVNFVMVHMGLGTDNSEAIELISKLPNLYGDTTWVPISSTLKFLQLCGSNKLLFGSDSPIDGVDTYHHNPKGETSLYQAYFNELKTRINIDDYDKIMYRNAIELFRFPL